jgi:hypothetical protein
LLKIRASIVLIDILERISCKVTMLSSPFAGFTQIFPNSNPMLMSKNPFKRRLRTSVNVMFRLITKTRGWIKIRVY